MEDEMDNMYTEAVKEVDGDESDQILLSTRGAHRSRQNRQFAEQNNSLGNIKLLDKTKRKEVGGRRTVLETRTADGGTADVAKSLSS